MGEFSPVLFPAAFLVSFLCSGMEAGFYALNPWRIRRLAREKRPSALLLDQHLRSPERYLWSLLAGNTIATLVLIWGWMAFVHQAFGGAAAPVGLSFLCGVVILFVLGDLLPKTLFRMFPNRLTLLFARPFQWMHCCLQPVVFLMAGFSSLLLLVTGGKAYSGRIFSSRREFRLLMKEAGPAISSDEHTLINRLLDLQESSLTRLVTPLRKLPSLPANATIAEARQFFHGFHLGYAPVTDPATQKVRAVLNLRRILYLDPDQDQETIDSRAQAPLVLAEDTSFDDALAAFQKHRTRFAIVETLGGAVVGGIFLEDVLRELFGEVRL